MVCLRNISVDTLHEGDTEDNNNNNKLKKGKLVQSKNLLLDIKREIQEL